MSSNLKPKNSKLPGWAMAIIIVVAAVVVLFYALIVFLIASAIVATVDYSNNYSITSSHNVKAEVDKAYFNNNTNSYVLEGTVSNNTNKEYDDVEISYLLYDTNNKIIGIATSKIDDLYPGEKRNFRALPYVITNPKEITKYKLLRTTTETDDMFEKNFYYGNR